jgi:signal transduction histidine kinase
MPDNVPLAAPELAARDMSPNAWEGSLRRWDAYNGIILAATIGVVLAAGPAGGRPVAVAALAAMAPWYLIIGRPATTADDAGSVTWPAWRGPVYLAGLIALLAVAVTASSQAAYILLVLCPQCFMALPSFGRAVLAVIVVNCTPAIAVLADHQPGGAVAVAAGIAAAGIAFSLVFGGWITGIIRQSAERAELIEQLEATRAELATAHRDAGTLAERQRMSAEIHDTLAQGFASIVMLLQAVEAGLATDPDGAGQHLRLATQTARENLAAARALVAGLAPAELEGGTLDDALRRVAAQAHQGGVAADVEVTGSVRPLTTGAEVMLLRVCQEALANVRKHAGASRASVRLVYDVDQVRLVISDDGSGFDPAVVRGGYGLRGMRTRVAEAGGAFTVRSAPSAGTAVSVTVPA